MKIIRLHCCDDCPYYNRNADRCNKGAKEYSGGEFFDDCLIETEGDVDEYKGDC